MNGVLHRCGYTKATLVSSQLIGLLFGEILAKAERETFSPKGVNRLQDVGTFTNLLLMVLKSKEQFTQF